MLTLTEVVDILDKQFLEWSRAKDRNDKEAIERAETAAVETLQSAVNSGLNIDDIMNLHKSHKYQLVAIRAGERASVSR